MHLNLLIDTTTFALELNEEVVVKARASNFNGFGLQSPESTAGALIVALPEAPIEAPKRDHSLSTLTDIVIDMTEVDSDTTGGLPILSYSLEWNSGGTQETNWSPLVGSSSDNLSLQFTVSALSTG